MKNFDLLILAFVVLNIVAGILKRRSRRQQQERLKQEEKALEREAPRPEPEPERPRPLLRQSQPISFDIFENLEFVGEESEEEEPEPVSAGEVEASMSEPESPPAPSKTTVSRDPTRTESKPSIFPPSRQTTVLPALGSRTGLRQAILFSELIGPCRALKPFEFE